MDMLARREHSQAELQKKLTAKDFSQEEILAVIEKLAIEGLQDDARFAENYTQHRVSAGLGPHRIVMELQTRGVSDHLIDQFVWKNDRNWSAHLEAVWQKKYGYHEKFGSKAYASQHRFLVQRGFDSEAIHQLLQAETS